MVIFYLMSTVVIGDPCRYKYVYNFLIDLIKVGWSAHYLALAGIGRLDRSGLRGQGYVESQKIKLMLKI